MSSKTDDVPAEALKPYTIKAEGISATLIGYGARVTHLFLKDKNGEDRDVIVGYDTPERYVQDTKTNHTYYGCMVGPYANRIKEGRFTIDGKTFEVDRNEHDGANTLHGGRNGYDIGNWLVTESSESSITFSLYGAAGIDGFPGAVQNFVTYSVLSSPPRFIASSVSVSLTQKTPIMPTTHIYWNIGGFLSPTVLEDTLHLPNADRFVVGDGILIPTGELRKLKSGDALDFTSPKKIKEGAGAKFCGEGAEGIDNAFVFNTTTTEEKYQDGPVQLQWTSADSGIQMSVRTNQPCIQVYAAAAQDGTIPLKKAHSQGKSTGFLEKNGCVVIEPQGIIDGINNPEWGQVDRQIKGPEDGPYVNWAEYRFDIV